jgi:hypothetical protein
VEEVDSAGPRPLSPRPTNVSAKLTIPNWYKAWRRHARDPEGAARTVGGPSAHPTRRYASWRGTHHAREARTRLGAARALLQRRVPADLADHVRLDAEVVGTAATILERRAPWLSDIGPEWSRLPLARLRFSVASSEWTPYWYDRNLTYHRYPGTKPSRIIDDLVAVLDSDPDRRVVGLTDAPGRAGAS